MSIKPSVSSDHPIPEPISIVANVLSHTFASSQTGVCLLDQAKHIRWANLAFARQVGAAQEELMGRLVEKVMPGWSQQMAHPYEQVRESGQGWCALAYLYTFPDQPERGATYWNTSLNPVKGEAGEFLGWLLEQSEATQQVRMDAQLQEMLEAAQRQNEHIAWQAEELQGLNHELQRQREEMEIQNEELQQQAEELEMQAEELEVQNQELAEANQRLQEAQAVAETQAQRAKQALHLLEDLLRQVPDGVMIAQAPSINLQHVSDYVLQITGMSRAELQDFYHAAPGRPWLMLRPDGTPTQREDAPLYRAIQYGETTRDREMLVRRADGSQVPVLISAVPVRDAKGNIIAGITVWRDITERKRAEEERERLLAENAQHRELLEAWAAELNAAFEGTHAQVALLDRHFNFVMVNSAYVAGCGHRREELIGRNHFDIFPNEENQAIFQWVRDTGQVYEVEEKPFEYADQPERGTTYWDWRLTPVKDGNQEISGVLLSLTDVTAQVQARRRVEEDAARIRELNQQLLLASAEQQRLTEEAQRRAAELDAMIRSAADGIVTYQLDGQVQWMNEAAHKLLQYSEEDRLASIAQRVETIRPRKADGTPFRPEETPGHLALQGKTCQGVVMCLPRANREIWVSVSASPIRTAENEVLGAVAFFTDISPIQELDRQKDEFLSIAAHELKTPMTSMKGFAQLLLRRASRLPETEPWVGPLKTIDQQVNRMAELVDKLLDVSRIQLGRLQVNPKPMDLIAMLEEAVAEAGVISAKHRVGLQTEMEELNGQWDRNRLYQVVSNLLSNAVKYSPRGGEVELRVWRESQEVVVSVRDEGMGIPAKDLPHVFDRNYRAGREEESSIAGLGLGLYIARGIIEAHGGRIWVESQEGRGSTFYFSLPIH